MNLYDTIVFCELKLWQIFYFSEDHPGYIAISFYTRLCLIWDKYINTIINHYPNQTFSVLKDKDIIVLK